MSSHQTPDVYAALPVVRMTKAEFDQLGEYSTSIPTGAYEGKRWKRNVYAVFRIHREVLWLQGQYLPSLTHPATHLRVCWSRIEIVETSETPAV